jgi:hypothetical protein
MVSVCTKSASGLALMTISLFFPSSSLSLPKILCSPLQNFKTTPSISFSFSGPYHFDYDFFLF